MAENKITREQLIELSNQMIGVRSVINRDHLNNLFTVVSLPDYAIMKKNWPNIAKIEEQDYPPVFLRQMQAKSDTPMSVISKMVQQLNDNGLVHWERGESGTYIILSAHGLRCFREQQELVLDYFERVITRIGIERFKMMLDGMQEIEEIMEEEILQVSL